MNDDFSNFPPSSLVSHEFSQSEEYVTQVLPLSTALRTDVPKSNLCPPPPSPRLAERNRNMPSWGPALAPNPPAGSRRSRGALGPEPAHLKACQGPVRPGLRSPEKASCAQAPLGAAISTETQVHLLSAREEGHSQRGQGPSGPQLWNLNCPSGFPQTPRPSPCLPVPWHFLQVGWYFLSLLP